MARNASPNLRGRRWATTKQTAEYIGITTRTVRAMVADGRLRQYSLGKRVTRFDLAEVDLAMTGGEPLAQPPQLRRGGRVPRHTPHDGAKLCSRCGAPIPADYFGPDRAEDGCCHDCEPDAQYQARMGSDPT
jgi:excisionase family DNA binding protein